MFPKYGKFEAILKICEFTFHAISSSYKDIRRLGSSRLIFLNRRSGVQVLPGAPYLLSSCLL
jgi:hypothetical protein